jgi:hypothetical protein
LNIQQWQGTDVMSSKISATREAFWLPSVEDAGHAKQIEFINFRACRASALPDAFLLACKLHRVLITFEFVLMLQDRSCLASGSELCGVLQAREVRQHQQRFLVAHLGQGRQDSAFLFFEDHNASCK